MKSILALSILTIFAIADSNTTTISDEEIQSIPSYVKEASTRGQLKKAVKAFSKGINIKPEERSDFKENGYIVLIDNVDGKNKKSKNKKSKNIMSLKPKNKTTFDCKNTKLSNIEFRPKTEITIKNCYLKRIEVTSKHNVNLIDTQGSIDIQTDGDIYTSGGLMKKLYVKKANKLTLRDGGLFEYLYINKTNDFDAENITLNLEPGFSFDNFITKNVKMTYIIDNEKVANNFNYYGKRTKCKIDSSVFLKGGKYSAQFCSEGMITNSFIPSYFIKSSGYNNSLVFVHCNVFPQGRGNKATYLNSIVDYKEIDCGDSTIINSTVPLSVCENSEMDVDFEGMLKPNEQPNDNYYKELEIDFVEQKINCDTYPQLRKDFNGNKRDCEDAWTGPVEGHY